MSFLSRSPRQPGNYLAEDTIAALASPVGGAISVVRLSGPGTVAIGTRLTGRDLSQQKAREVVRCDLRDSAGRKLDDAVITLYRGPKSYSGEDVLELFLHGSPLIGSEVLKALYHFGARPALPGEFSFRAVRNGKLDLSQARAVADLISATNRGAVDLALEKLAGSQSALLTRLAEELRTLASLAELGIDFADQDVEEVSLPRLKDRARAVLSDLEKLESSFQRGSRIQEGISVAFIGRPNTGKSSFFNALLGEDRSIVTEIAGTTRDIVREKLTLQGKNAHVTLRMEDTAGIRSGTQDPVERIGIERSQKAAGTADLVLLLMDLRQLTSAAGSSEKENIQEVWRTLGEPRGKTLGILTKLDLVSEEEQRAAVTWVEKSLGISAVAVSALKLIGIEEAARRIAEHGEALVARDEGEVLLTQMEQVLSVREAITHLQASLETFEESLFAADIRHALIALSPVIGDTLPDDILGRIFSQFCIGK